MKNKEKDGENERNKFSLKNFPAPRRKIHKAPLAAFPSQ
jgi:hypothetical protein